MPRKTTKGLPCPECGLSLSEVIETRMADGHIARRRECPLGHRYTTHEHLAPEYVKGMVPAADLARSLDTLLRDAARTRS